MDPLDNILFSNERIKINKQPSKHLQFDKNIEYIYQRNTGLREKSVKDILQFESLESIKLIYSDFINKSDYKLNTYRKIQKEISEQIFNANNNSNILFSAFLSKISLYLKQQIISSLKYQNLKIIISNEEIFFEKIQKQFEKQMYKLSYRTLVLDYNFQKEKGTLKGNTEKKRISHYNQILLNDPTFIIQLFNRFPCLLRIISNEIRKLKKFILELLHRFKKDYKVVTIKLLSKQQQNIKYIDFGLGDTHCDGRRTTKIVLEKDIIIYKPRNASPDFFYAEMIKLWNQKGTKYNVKFVNGVYRESYSWFEYIEYKKCTDYQQLKDFYRRLGIQLAFLYALSATDFHFENIIAQGEYPILIDLECLFQIPNAYKIEKNNDAQSIVEHKIATSVYAVGLLPTSLGENNIDISGIGSTNKIKSIRKVPQINTHTMQIEQKIIELETKNKNKPILLDKPIETYKYTKYLLCGFKMGYMHIKENQSELLRLIEKYKMKLQVRYLLKGTVDYTSILNLSVHPRLLHNYIDRELYLAKMCALFNTKTIFNKEIACDEYKSLINGDIPYYSNKITSKHLINSKRNTFKNYFAKTPYDFVKQKIECFSTNDLEIQMDIIKGAMKLNTPLQTTTTFSQIIFDKLYKVPKNEYLKEKAIEIVQHLKKRAVIGCDSQNVSWINTSIIDGKFHLSSMNDSLYDGLSGISLMYLSLWKITKENDYLATAEKIVFDIMSRIDSTKKDIPIGAFTGVSSILYTVLNFYALTDKAVYALYAKKLVFMIRNKLPKDSFLDVISGIAGTLIVLIRYYELTRELEILELAKKCGDLIINKAIKVSSQEVGWITIDKKPLSGFSHGNAGIIFALHLLNKHINSKNIKDIISKGLRFEVNNKYRSRWNDLRTSKPGSDIGAWCHGSAGILLSRLELQSSDDNYIINQSKIDIDHAIFNIKQFGFGKEQNLCHGDIGNALIMLKYAEHTQEEKWNVMLQDYFSKVIPSYILELQNNIKPLGLMTGLAGVVYGLLLFYDLRLPNVLTLELGKTTYK
ncbi:type 2 lantipeptide synthetase LanM [Bacillus thuringiensis]|uniref:type 2 lanthipeptide synthetase LanM family protein n=1 Tax=Bacillus thuringiensis TaxID=1428 RepID=UPI000BEBDCA1|nr:type 2 lanthipeptide synthetase LanM family protein [Bacillus thuringiensis]PDY98441.1 type 2 lantipeptide synthetase LanM [Bacillus thuringiensis]PGV55724.1 type 2 lantipeptide synthetase LanM [Bacillus thuringiensis]QGV10644.1 type 2 lantipeptide synthetase LanM [Bacillus cereus]